LGVAGCTTALVLMDKTRLKEREKVLVPGASGRIGSQVVQLAKAAAEKRAKSLEFVLA